ncbi:MAG TPA: hypothetical protein VMN60_08015 [Longimicrobiales bacterium]|nr:hypothetical protein [Longimicrobiales bacterium]
MHRISGNGCAPLAGVVVDLWQCDAEGRYSDVRDTQGRFDTRGQQFLRGFQTTTAEGVARFRTIYPGWYAGRTPHLHFKIRLIDGARTTHEFTSQLYFEEATSDDVYAQAPYAARGARSTTNARDGIFRGGGTGAQLMLPLSAAGDGYTGSFEIGLLMT